ncbi:MAG TPA: phosphoribosyltransferase [Thermoanaerobaculia bacterium]
MLGRPTQRYRNREEAGRVLARALGHYAGRPDVVLLALPRGGVPIAFEVAEALDAPLDVFVVRKLGVPGHEELAMGAIATGDTRVLNHGVIRDLAISSALIDEVTVAERRELERREKKYRGERPPLDLRGRTVILIDDGLATGSTMRAAIAAVRQKSPTKIVVGVPVAPTDACEDLNGEVDEIVCARTPEPFYAVGLWYEEFDQTTDEEVHDLLERSRARSLAPR